MPNNSQITKRFRLAVLPAKRLSGLIRHARSISLRSAIGVAGVVALGTIGYQGVLRYGRVLLRLRTLEEQLDHLVDRNGSALGLPVGRVVIEDFELAELRGGRMSFSQWRGHELLLIFFDPSSV